MRHSQWRMRRRAWRATAGVALAAASILGLAGPASAHNYLVSSTPAAGQTLTTLPERFVITTNEGLLDLSGHGAGFALDIRDSHGLYYGDGCVSVSGPSLSVRAAIGAAGEYTVIWQAVSADGHIVSYSFPFTWAPSGSVTPSTGRSTPANCGGRSGGAAAAPNDAAPNPSSKANLGLVLGIGGGVLGLGVLLTITLLLVSRKKPAPPAT